jgi:hypothetical protein
MSFRVGEIYLVFVPESSTPSVVKAGSMWVLLHAPPPAHQKGDSPRLINAMADARHEIGSSMAQIKLGPEARNESCEPG